MQGGDVNRKASKVWSTASLLTVLLGLTHCGGTQPPPEAEGELAQLEQALALPTLTFAPEADAWVEESSPHTSHGSTPELLADGSPTRETWLRFRVSAVPGRVTQAKLRLYAFDPTEDGPAVYDAQGGWSEDTLTWSNRPALQGPPVADVGAISLNRWAEWDVTSLAQDCGTHDFVLVPTSGNGVDFYSRESSQTALRPQLVLTYEPGTAGCTEPTDV